jgi:hypothetical protein
VNLNYYAIHTAVELAPASVSPCFSAMGVDWESDVMSGFSTNVVSCFKFKSWL